METLTTYLSPDLSPVPVNPKHSAKSQEWGTPGKIVELARALMGRIDLDPASCELANQTVKALGFYSEDTNGLDKEWTDASRGPSRVWLNPPGKIQDRATGKLVASKKLFWNKLVVEYLSGNVEQACYLCYSQEELATSQSNTLRACLDFPTVILRQRLKYKDLDSNTVPTSPPCTSALVYLPPKDWLETPQAILNFYRLFKDLGKVMMPFYSEDV